MPRKNNYADDEHRLPTGFQRTGYDADTQTYRYTAPDGAVYQGQPGQRFGVLEPIPFAHRPWQGISPQRTQQNIQTRAIDWDFKSSWRYFSPFLLLVCLVLFLLLGALWRGEEPMKQCQVGEATYKVRQGDTCYDIAEKFSTSVEELERVNVGLVCDVLKVGSEVCVPGLE